MAQHDWYMLIGRTDDSKPVAQIQRGRVQSDEMPHHPGTIACYEVRTSLKVYVLPLIVEWLASGRPASMTVRELPTEASHQRLQLRRAEESAALTQVAVMEQALDAIADVLSKDEWAGADDMPAIQAIVEATGRDTSS